MTEDITRLQKLAQVSRSRRNMEKVQGELDNLEELRDALESWLDSAYEIRQTITAFAETFGQIDAVYLPDGAHDRLARLVSDLEPYLPDEDGMLAAFYEQFDVSKEGIEELESMLEDRDYSADDRDDKWYEATEALDNIATALDELSGIGAPPAGSGAPTTEEGTA